MTTSTSTKKDGSSIFVGIRIRPPNEKEDKNEVSWTTDGLHLISGVSGSSCGSSAAKADSYRFDRVFHQSCTTQDVYRGAAQDIVRSCLDGMNGTVFAYGQTSTGKTHTMMGTNGSGVIPMSVRHIFELVAERDTETEYLLRVSYLEIYDEQICDLLEPSNKPVVRAEARPSDSDGGEMGVGIFGLKEESVTSAEALLEHMREGERNRRIGKTNMNEESSRSHAIFRIVIESRQRQAAADVRVSMLTLVDLAGSENTQKAGTAGVRAREGQAINKSLLALSNVINALAKGQAFVPYRNSALTRILQPALGGNSRTAIICTVALSQHHRSETHSTLKFASRAANVRNKPIVNVIVDDSARLVVLRREIQALKDQLKANTATREALIMEESTAEGDEDVAGDKTTGIRSAELIAKIEEQEAIRTEQEAKIHRLEALIVNSGSTATAESTKTEGKKQALRRGTVCASTFSFWSMGGAASSCNSDESTHAAGAAGPTLLSNAPPALIDFDNVSQDHNHLQGQSQQSMEQKDGEGSKGRTSEYFSLLREKSGLQRKLRNVEERNRQLEEEVSQHTQQTISAMQQREHQILKEIATIFGLEQQVDLATLKRSLFQFRDYVTQFQKVYQQQTKVIETSTKQIADLQSANQELLTSLEEKAAAVAERDVQIEELEEKSTAWQTALADKEADFAALHESQVEQSRELESQISEQSDQLALMQLRLEAEQKRVAEMEEAAAIERTARAMREGCPSSPSPAAASAFDQLAKRRQSGSALTRRKSIAPRSGTVAEPSVMANSSTIQALQNENEELVAGNRQLKMQIMALGGENKHLQIEVGKVTQQLEGVTKKLRAFETKHRASFQTIEQLLQDKQRLENELKETRRLKSCADKGQEKLKTVADQLKEEKKAHQSSREELAAALEGESKNAGELAAAVAKASQQGVELEGVVAERDELAGENYELKQRIMSWNAERTALQQGLAAAEGAHQAVEKRREEQQRKHGALSKAFGEQTRALEKCQAAVGELRDQLELQKAENAHHNEQLEQLRGCSRAVVETQAEMRKLHGEHELLQKRYADTVGPIERSKARIQELEQRDKELFAKLLRAEQALSDCNEAHEAKLGEAANAQRRKRGVLKEKILGLKATAKEQESQLAENRMIIDSMKRELDRSQQQRPKPYTPTRSSRDLDDEAALLNAMGQEKEALAAELARTNEELAVQRKSSQQAAALGAQLEQKVSLIKELKQRLAAALGNTQTVVMCAGKTPQKENPADTAKMHEELAAQKLEIRRYKKKIHDLMAMIKSLQGSYQDSLNVIKEVDEERAMLQEKLASQIN